MLNCLFDFSNLFTNLLFTDTWESVSYSHHDTITGTLSKVAEGHISERAQEIIVGGVCDSFLLLV